MSPLSITVVIPDDQLGDVTFEGMETEPAVPQVLRDVGKLIDGESYMTQV